MRYRFSWLLLFGLVLPVGSWAQTLSTAGEGLTAMDLPAGPKATALGGAFSAWADDTSAVYWNPAGMAFFPKVQIQTSFNQWFQDAFYQDVGGVLPQSWGALGGRISYVNLGSFTGRDVFGYTTGITYSPEDWGGTFAAATKLGPLALGLAAKGYEELLPDYNYGSIGLDAGALLRLGFLSLSGGARNIGLVSNYTFPTEAYTGCGLAWDIGPLDIHLTTDANFTTQGDALHHGLELGFQKTVFLRAGYQWFLTPLADQTQTGFSGGAGLDLSGFTLDYAWVTYGTLGNTNQVAVGYRFDLPTAQTTPDTDDDDYGTTPSTPPGKQSAASPAPTPAVNLDALSLQEVYHRGIEAYKQKDYDLAEFYFKGAAGKFAKEGGISYKAQADIMLGVLYEYHRTRPDHLSLAIGYYQSAVNLDPSNTTVQKHLDELGSADPSN